MYCALLKVVGIFFKKCLYIVYPKNLAYGKILKIQNILNITQYSESEVFQEQITTPNRLGKIVIAVCYFSASMRNTGLSKKNYSFQTTAKTTLYF